MLNFNVYPGPSRRMGSVPEIVVMLVVAAAAMLVLLVVTLGLLAAKMIAHFWRRVVQITA